MITQSTVPDAFITTAFGPYTIHFQLCYFSSWAQTIAYLNKF